MVSDACCVLCDECYVLFVDNLAANFSRELADYIIYVIDVSVSRLVLPRLV